MGDENPIHTLEDYSRPSHEGYRNTIELPEGKIAGPLRSDTIRLVQNGCSFHGLRSEDPKQHLNDFLKLVDSLDLDFTNRERTCLSQYEDEGWNHPVILEEGNLDYKNPDIEHLLGVTEYKVDRLMKDALSLMGRSEGIFRMTSNERYQLPPEPSRQKEFKHIMTNFILDQEERVWQLEEYMKVIVGDFMQLSSKVTRRLKEKIREEGSRMRKIEKITKYPDIEVSEPLAREKFSENPAKKTFPNTPKSTPKSSLCIGYVHPMFSNPPSFRKSTFGFK
ncbi:hypothetical protein Tco_1260353 [Tanacetum coccineum]